MLCAICLEKLHNLILFVLFSQVCKRGVFFKSHFMEHESYKTLLSYILYK